MSYNFDIHYEVGGAKFFNIFQAFDEQIKTGLFPNFVPDHDLIKNISNFKKPKNLSRDYIRNLMVTRLKYLRKKYQKFKLCYSGGTDSYTILKLCVENDIYIDETVTQMVSLKKNLRTNLEYAAGLKLAKKYEGTIIGKCVVIHPTLQDLNFLNEPDWFKNHNYAPGCYIPWRVFSVSDIVKKSIEDDTDTIFLLGHEKPRIFMENGVPMWTSLDSDCGEMMGIKNAVPFFLDKDNPELVVALTYATLEHIKIPKKTSFFFPNSGVLDRESKLRFLDSCGYYKSPYNFINMALMGKAQFDWNRKNIRFHKELESNGKNLYLEKMLDTRKKIKSLYQHLPHAIEITGKFIKTVGRYSQKIPILQHKFGG